MKLTSTQIALLIIVFFLPTKFYAQSFCGSYTKPGEAQLLDPKEEHYMDRFGNFYSKEEIRSSKTKTLQEEKTLAGDFEIEFSSNFSNEEEATIRAAFEYISTIITLGPGGIPPIINIQKEQLNPGVLGAGSPFFERRGCGYSFNRTYISMHGGVNQEEDQLSYSGYLFISEDYDFHTLDEDSGNVNGYDLYTIALHEILHILAFSSLINADGSNPDSYYSKWDEFLFNADLNESLITVHPGNSSCCELATFNPLISFPEGLEDNCNNNIFFNDGVSFAQVNATYTGSITDGTSKNILSHLDRCGSAGDQYVMFSSLAEEELRRELDPAEMEILFAMGYTKFGGSDTPCDAIAVFDLIPISGDEEIPFTKLLENDIYPAGANIYINENCGSLKDHADITITSTGILIENADYGAYTFCYQLEGCDGICFQMTSKIYYLPQLPECVDCETEELFCYGDFEDFIAQSRYGIDGQLGQPTCVYDNGYGVTADIHLTAEGGKIVRLFGSESFNAYEYLQVPLSPPLEPGCEFEICLDVISINFCSNSGLNILGTSNEPCDGLYEPGCFSNNNYHCIGFLEVPQCESNLPSITLQCGDPFYPPEFPCDAGILVKQYTQSFEFSTICMQATNTSSEAWNYILIANDGSTIFDATLLDNLHIKTECCKEEPDCSIELIETCKENSVTLTVLENGVPIPMYNAECCVSWSGIPGIPTFTCPPGSGMPAQNFNNIGVPYGIEYCVEIVCKDCSFEYCGIAGDLCEPGGEPVGGSTLNPMIQIAPNPASNYLEISGEDITAGQQWTIYDLNGRAVISGISKTDNRQEMNISGLLSGLYYIQVSTPSGEIIFTERFIKQ